MEIIERNYYPITLAASIIGCSTNDMIHWAANEKIRLGVLFCIENFSEQYYTCLQDFDWNRVVANVSFHGFAYVSADSFLSMERLGGGLKFNFVTTLDGLAILNHPGRKEGYYGTDTRSLDEIFIHRTDLLPLLAGANDAKNSGKPLLTTERNSLLTIIASLCDYSAIEHQGRGAASQIAKLTEELGAAVSVDTVRRTLAKIPDALETRLK